MKCSLEFRPHDVLFFRDGRPMSGATHGDGSHFPHPHILHAALHAALHRAFPDPSTDAHTHRRVKRNRPQSYQPRAERVLDAERVVRFGALQSLGPFPAVERDEKLSVAFPAPANVLIPPKSNGSEKSIPLIATRPCSIPGLSSLPHPLKMAPAPILPPAKRNPASWISKTGIEAWLADDQPIPADTVFQNSDFFATESTIGIAIDSSTGTTLESQFYSKSQIRLRPKAALVGFASMTSHRHQNVEDGLIEKLFPQHGQILIGGERRVCEVTLNREKGISSILPQGPGIEGNYVKWLLLTPAIFPWLPANPQRTQPHPGGWLPSWINPSDHSVQLLDGPGKAKAERIGSAPGKPIRARLVAAQVPRPLIITGWSSHGENRADETDEASLGARSTLLAVPAGSIYYFEAANPEQASKLAAALNWHGSTTTDSILNRRSTLFGEKGFGIGVCGPWQPLNQTKAATF